MMKRKIILFCLIFVFILAGVVSAEWSDVTYEAIATDDAETKYALKLMDTGADSNGYYFMIITTDDKEPEMNMQNSMQIAFDSSTDSFEIENFESILEGTVDTLYLWITEVKVDPVTGAQSANLVLKGLKIEVDQIRKSETGYTNFSLTDSTNPVIVSRDVIKNNKDGSTVYECTNIDNSN